MRSACPRSALIRGRPEAAPGGSRTEALLAAAREALRPLDAASAELCLTRPPLVSNKAVIYFLGRRAGRPLYVAKAPAGGKTAAAEYGALRQCHAWWRSEDRHRVAEPLALLPRGDGFLTAYVPGPGLAQVLSRPLWRRGRAIEAAGAAGDFLRRLHAHARVDGDHDIELSDLVAGVRAVEAGELRPAGLALPASVARVLDAAPRRRLRARRARLHGDYAPRNLVLCGPGEVAMLDPALKAEGVVEDDIATFLSMMSSASVFAAAPAAVLLDATDKHLEEEVRDEVEGPGDARITDLHVWRLGPGAHSAIVSYVGVASAEAIRARLAQVRELKHVTVETY